LPQTRGYVECRMKTASPKRRRSRRSPPKISALEKAAVRIMRLCPGRSRLARERLGSTIADRRRAQLGRMRSFLRKCSAAAAHRTNHRHHDRGGPLPQAPRGQHFQGSQAPKSAQAAQECQLLLNTKVRRGWGHATKTPRNAFSYRPHSDRSANRAAAHAGCLGATVASGTPTSSARRARTWYAAPGQPPYFIR
jgi:hypothetical protein